MNLAITYLELGGCSLEQVGVVWVVFFYRSSVCRVYLLGSLSNKAVAPSKNATDAVVFWIVLPSVDDLRPQ